MVSHLSCFILPTFPIGSLETLAEIFKSTLLASNAVDSFAMCRVKYHFIPSDIKQFEKLLLQLFILEETFQYSEEYIIDQDIHSDMKSKTWIKIKTVNGSKEFIKKETNLEESELNIIKYQEVIERYFRIPDELSNSVTLLVQRKKYIFSNQFPLHLAIDEVEFPDGKLYTEFTLFIDIPLELGKEFCDIVQQMKDETLSRPVRNKFIQYIYIYQPDIYSIFERDKLVLPSPYYKNWHISLFEKYHRRSILFRIWKKEFKNLEDDKLRKLSINLGMRRKELRKLLKNKLVDNRMREIISNYYEYSPLTKKVLQERELSENDLYKYVDIIHMRIDKELRNKFKVFKVGYSLPTLYGFPLVEFFSLPSQFSILEESFKEEISSGFVRLSCRKLESCPVLM